MKPLFAVLAVLFAGLLVLASVNTAEAQWPAIKESGYAVTTNWHGIDVPPWSTVVATAGTTDLSVLQVRFEWHAPDGTTPFDEWVAVSSLSTPNVPLNVPQEVIDWANGEPAGTQYLYAQSTHVVNIIGDWGIQGKFKDTVQIRGQGLAAIRATSLNVVPEVPFGTIVILLSWFGALGVFALRRKCFPTGMPT